jgi:hypothetical protein
VLALDAPTLDRPRPVLAEPVSIGQVLREMMEPAK